MSNTTSTKSVLAKSIGLKAVEAHSKRAIKGVAFEEGSRHEVDLEITGTVNGSPFHDELAGELVVGMGSPTGSTKNPNAKHLFCAALEIMAKTRREKLIEALISDDGVPEPSDEIAEVVNSLFKQLQTKGPKAGAVSFQPSVEE